MAVPRQFTVYGDSKVLTVVLAFDFFKYVHECYMKFMVYDNLLIGDSHMLALVWVKYHLPISLPFL